MASSRPVQWVLSPGGGGKDNGAPHLLLWCAAIRNDRLKPEAISQTQRPEKVALELVILQPEISDLRVSLDPLWVAQHPEAEPGKVATTTTIPGFPQFLDADGNELTSMQRLVQDRIKEFGHEGQTSLEAEFPDPTYMELLNEDGIPVCTLKTVRLTATLDIIKTIVTMPLFSRTTATYLFKKAIESDHRYVLVAQRGSDLVAEVSVPLRSFRIG